MINLFAGLGPGGEMRFIGEVERGAACGCRCPECDSPLVAKQGNEKEWHFAHEAGQERPECLVGAMNMLRRLAIEQLQRRDRLLLPPYRISVFTESPLGGRTETVEWSAQFQGKPDWVLKAPRGASVASGLLDSGLQAAIFVEIDEPSAAELAPSPAAAAILFTCSVPPMGALRDRNQAEQHIARYGRFEWRHHPDIFGLQAAAQDRVDTLAKQDAEVARRGQEERARDAGRRWAAIGQRLQAREPLPLQRTSAAPVDAATSPVARASHDYAWAPRMKSESALIFYRLTDGTAWVVYTMVDDTVAIAPWPKEEGWDEALPPSVGVADEALGVYRGKKLEAVMIFLGQRAVRVRATRDPREFEGL
jgi:hypothetical protein